MTLEETAQVLRLSPAGVKLIEARALAKLRKTLRKRGVTFSDFAALLDGDKLDRLFK